MSKQRSDKSLKILACHLRGVFVNTNDSHHTIRALLEASVTTIG